MYLIKEKIAPEFQSQDFELNIEAISLRSKKFEINTNMYKIGVVIDGSIELMYRDKVKELKKEDVFLINPGRVYGLCPTSKNNLMLILNIDEAYILKKFSNRPFIPYFNLELLESKEKFLLDIYRIVQMYYYKTEVGFQGFLREIDRLINNLILDNKFEENKFLNTWIREEAISKMKEIFDFPDNKLKLEDISKQFNVKSSFMSKVFKHILGYSFVDAYHMAQIGKVVELLINTDENILEIAFDCGFSSSKTFHENFKKYFKETPNTFRKNILLSESKFVYSSFDKVMNSDILKNIINCEGKNYYENLRQTYEISVDERSLDIEENFREKSIFSASNLGRNWLYYIPEIQKNIGFNTIRVEIKICKDNIFIREGVDVWTPLDETNAINDIQLIDKINVRIHMVLKMNIDVKQNINCINDMMDKFFDILFKALRISKIKSWNFELDMSYLWKNGITYNVEDRCKQLYAMWNTKINTKIGSKLIGVHIDEIGNLKDEEFILFMEKTVFSVHRPDFISVNLTDRDIYSKNVPPEEFSEYISGIQNEIKNYTERYDTDGKNKIEVYISTLRIFDYTCMVPNKYHEILSALGNAWGLTWVIKTGIPVASVEYFSKRYNNKKEFEENLEIFCRKLSLFNKYSIKNLDFYVYKFIFELYANFIKVDDGIIVTTNGADYKIILFQNMGENLQYIFNKKEYLKEYPGREITLIINGLKGAYKFKVSTLRTEKGTMYYEANKFGETDEFDLNDIEYLKNKVIPKMKVEKVNLNGNFKRNFKLGLFEIKFIEIIKIG